MGSDPLTRIDPTGEAWIQVIVTVATACGTAARYIWKWIGSSKPKPGDAGGPGAGKNFPQKIKDQAREESNNTCVFCGGQTARSPGPNRSEIDHAIPKSRGGNNTPKNAQNTCRTCNRSKGAKTTQEYLEHISNN